MDLLSWLGRSGYLPHGVCLNWSPGVLWAMVAGDAVIAASYFSIPLAILSFLRQRPDLPNRSLAWLFGAFIAACGVTHVLAVWTLWQPDYGIELLAKLVTAAVSLATAVALWRLVPRALRIPSAAQHGAVVDSLQGEVARRRSAEDHLGETQRSLAVTLASIDAGFIATDAQGRVTRMNAVAERVTGWTQAQAFGQSLWQVFQRVDRAPEATRLNPVEAMQKSGVTVETAHHVTAVARDGGHTAVEVKAGLTTDEDGTVRGLAMVLRDLSGQALAAVQASRLAAIVESSNDAIIGKTLEGRITSWNRAAEAMFGYRADEALGQRIQMLFPPERTDEEMRILAQLAHGQHVPPFETVRRARDGRLLDVSISISPIRDGDGRIVGASKIARDITPQRQAEAALRESESRLRFALESAQLGDWDLNLATGVAQRSLRHDRCFGYETLQPQWTLDIFIAHVHEEDRPAVVRELRQAIDGRSEWHVECRVVWPDGSVHWIRSHGNVRQEAGRATHMLGIVADITMSKLAEQARLTALRLEDENRRIQEASRLKSQFLANMSHELRTPLNAVIGFADLLHGGIVKPDSPKHREFLGHIGTSGRHLLQLINDVLDLSKVEAGKFEFFPEPVQLPQIVKEALDVVHTALTRKSLQVQVDIDPALQGLELDPARLKQALYNYLSNAIKFTPEGGRLVVRARPEGPAHFRLEVEDSGIGIAPSDLPRLFTEFQQLDSGPAKQHAGTGLGLALTRRLVQAQGGQVGVRSVPGVGSVFHLVLPRRPGAAPAPAVAPVAAWQMLVIQHDPAHQARLVRALAAAGFRVDVATTGVQALRHASARPYSAITLDLLLPDRHGLGLLADIRSEGASRDSPVVGMSMSAGIDGAASFAIADVLSKPIRTDQVVAAMQPLRTAGGPPLRVMVVDDDPLALDLMRATLAGAGIEALCVGGGREALRDIDSLRPDAMILDLMMPGFDGFAVLNGLSELLAWQNLPVFVWTSMVLSEDEYASLARSARAILSKGGGALEPVLDRLRLWRPAAAPAGEG